MITRPRHEVKKISHPLTLAGRIPGVVATANCPAPSPRKYYRTITDEAFIFTDPATGEIAFSFPTADDRLTCAESVHRFLHHRRGGDGRTLQALEGKHAEYQEQFAQHQVELPEVFTRFGGDPEETLV